MRDWDAIVVGAGLGGLSAAATLARAGRRVLVLERLNSIGGAATSYRREGMNDVEASLHDLDGAALAPPRGVLHQLGVTKRLKPISPSEFYEVRSALFQPLRVPFGLEEMEAAVGAAFPGAQAGLRQFSRALRRLHGALDDLQKHAGAARALVDLLLSGRAFEILRSSRLTVEAAMERLFGSDEPPKLALCAPLSRLNDDPSQTSFLAYADFMSGRLVGGSVYLSGGSRSIAAALADAIMAQGGQIRTGRTVSSILLDSRGRASGVAHTGADGATEDETARVVIGNAAPGVLAAMLPPLQRSRFDASFAGRAPSQSLFSVTFGIDHPAAEFGVCAFKTFIYPDWLQELAQYSVSADVFGGLPGAAMPLYTLVDYSRLSLPPKGPLRQLTLTGADRLWAWDEFDADEDRDRRARWIEAFIADLDRRFPGLKGAVRHAEMATARTMHNRLGTPHGEVFGFKPTPGHLFARRGSPLTTVPGLLIASAYTLGGGFVGALNGGRLAAATVLSSMTSPRAGMKAL